MGKITDMTPKKDRQNVAFHKARKKGFRKGVKKLISEKGVKN